MLASALVTFVSLWLLIQHIPAQRMRRVVGYMGWFDLILHGTIIYLFIGTFSGLMQAEAAGIMISLYLRLYRWAFGYERRQGWKWMRWPGRFTRIAS
jgi:hypothetical protein